jgi:hypothetical protein
MKKLHICLAQVLLAAYLLISVPAEASASKNGSAQPCPIGSEAGCEEPHRGPTGPTGPTGPPGEASAYIAGYADGTTLTGAIIPLDLQIVNIGSPILFNVPGITSPSDPNLPFKGITYNAVLGFFTVETPGIYEINYEATFVGTTPPINEGATFFVPVISVLFGSTEIPESYTAGYADDMTPIVSLGDWVSGSVIVSITDPATQTISLINSIMTSATPLQLWDLAQVYPSTILPPVPTTTAFITIERIQ